MLQSYVVTNNITNKVRTMSFIFAVITLVGFQLTLAAGQVVGKFVSFDVPGANLTRPNDVNNLGVIVGRFDDKNGTHGFVFADGVFTTIDYPGAGLTAAQAINDSGQIVGRFTKNGVDHGFLLSSGSFSQIDFPGAVATQCHGINKNGDIVGRYLNPRNPAQGGGAGRLDEHGWLLHANQFTSIDFPNANTTDAWKIADNGTVVGDWTDNGGLSSGSLHGYSVKAGNFFSFDFPGVLGTASRKVNSSGWMVGIYIERKIVDHGFLQINGQYTGFDFPGSAWTDGNSINNAGMIVGSYADSSGREHGYGAVARDAAFLPFMTSSLHAISKTFS